MRARPSNSGSDGAAVFNRREWRFLSIVLLAFTVVHALPAVDTPSAAGSAPRQLLLAGTRAPADHIIVVGERGSIFDSADNGRTWRTASSPSTATLTGVTFAPDSSLGWAVGHDALILATTDAGRTWQKQWQGENLSDSFLDLVALDSSHVIAVGAYGLCVSTADGGKTWTRRKIIDDDSHLNRLTRGPSGTLYLAGEHGLLLRSINQGETWSKITAPYDGSFYGVLPIDDHTIVAHGLRGRVFRSDDDGATWTPCATSQPVLLAASVRLKNNVIILAGHPRVVFLSRDSGRTFSPWATSLSTAVSQLLELPDGHLLALGEAGVTILAPPAP